eukprot:6058883-Prymnesium_polylepis.1
MAAERVTTAVTIENAYEAELRVDTDVSVTIDMLIGTFEFAPGLVAWGHKSQVWLDSQPAGEGRERGVGVATVAVMASNDAEHAAAVDAP